MEQFSIDTGAKIGQVHLRVSDLNKALEFYESFLGFKIVKKTPQTIFLSGDGKLSYIVALSKAKTNDSLRRSGLYHFAILLPQKKDLADFLSHLLKNKDVIKIDGFADHLVSEAIYIRDPDNIGIEIYHDRSPTEWKWNNNQIKMAVESLDINSLLKESSSWNGIPSKTTIGHVHLHVSNLAKAKKFYSEILGLSNTASMSGALFFAAGKYHHHIATNTWLGENISKASPNSVGLEYFTISFSDRNKLNEILDRLKFLKIKVKEFRDGSFGVSDEDKISIRLVSK